MTERIIRRNNPRRLITRTGRRGPTGPQGEDADPADVVPLVIAEGVGIPDFGEASTLANGDLFVVVQSNAAYLAPFSTSWPTIVSGHVNDPSAAHAGSAISISGVSGLDATDVQAGFEEVVDEFARLDGATFTGLTRHEAGFSVQTATSTEGEIIGIASVFFGGPILLFYNNSNDTFPMATLTKDAVTFGAANTTPADTRVRRTGSGVLSVDMGRLLLSNDPTVESGAVNVRSARKVTRQAATVKTAGYSLTSGDINRTVIMSNSAPRTFTIGSEQAWSSGEHFRLVRKGGAHTIAASGATTFFAAAGTSASVSFTGTGGVVTCEHLGADEWLLYGDVA